MTKYYDVFEETASDDTVFANKGALDPLAEPGAIRGWDDQEAQLAGILNGIHEGISRRRDGSGPAWHQQDGDVAAARHCGPMAEELSSLFGLGADNEHLASLDSA